MEWINSVKPDVDAFIIGNLSDDGELSINSSQDARKEVRVALNALRKDDGILVIPTVLGCPPKLNARELSSSNYNVQTSCLTSLSSMSGCCQVALPLGTHDKCPISVSFIARHGGDQFLLDTIQTIKVATYYSNRAAAFLELASYRQAKADCTSAIDIDQKGSTG
ncbi:hypothetical protein GUJ93_ZPchr0013g33919 [Zizania palustris]|uniref:Amidase domain-containing protein n=1 Tax=Zizania palustris TaxID=103762 RepID=A0A8J6BZ93_ZIZPA|nr:hypothetical protein GUJ93_ZPchr0013g33919 [Zizania palustris]